VFDSLRPIAGAPRVVPVTIVTASSGVGTPYTLVATPGSFGGDLIAVYDIFAGPSAIVVHILGPDGDEQAGIPLAANSFYSLTLCGIGGIKFRSSVSGATATLVITPQVTDRPMQDPSVLMDAEMYNMPPTEDKTTGVLVSGYPRG
jgi:hypothetical protein